VVTALNPIIGYAAGASLVKEALKRDIPILDVAREKALNGLLINQQTGEKVSEQEIISTLSDLRRLTEGGIIGGATGGG